MRMLLIQLLLLAFASPAFADDLKGKFPKKFVEDVVGDTLKERWAFGTKVLPTKRAANIQFGDWIDDKQEYFKMSDIMPMEVRKDNGDGWVRIHDNHREGWVQKEDLVSVEDAPIYWDKAVKVNPKDTWALSMRANSWGLKGELDNALADYNECIRLEPGDAVYYNSRGTVWRRKKQYDKAIADYTEAIRLKPDYALAHNNRGNSWSNVKEYDKAIADYTESIRLDPKNVLVQENRGYTCYLNKMYDKAIHDFDDALMLDPKRVFSVGVKAMTLAKLKKYDAAVGHFEKALRLEQKDWVYKRYAFFRATCLNAKFRDGKKAVEMAKLAIEKAGKGVDWEYFATLAAAYAEVGDFDLALTEQRKALDDKHLDATDKKEQEARLALYRAKKPYRDE